MIFQLIDLIPLLLPIFFFQFGVICLILLFQKGNALPLTVMITIAEIIMALHSIQPDFFIH